MKFKIKMLNISGVLDRSAEKWPEKKFLIFNDNKITYQSFRKRVLQWVFYLRKNGVKRGDIVSVFSKDNFNRLNQKLPLTHERSHENKTHRLFMRGRCDRLYIP